MNNVPHGGGNSVPHEDPTTLFTNSTTEHNVVPQAQLPMQLLEPSMEYDDSVTATGGLTNGTVIKPSIGSVWSAQQQQTNPLYCYNQQRTDRHTPQDYHAPPSSHHQHQNKPLSSTTQQQHSGSTKPPASSSRIERSEEASPMVIVQQSPVVSH